MIANVVVPEARLSAAVVNWEASEKYAYESAAIGKTVAEDVAEAVECEYIFPVSVEVNGSPSGVILDGTIALGNYEPIISTPKGITVHAGDDAKYPF